MNRFAPRLLCWLTACALVSAASAQPPGSAPVVTLEQALAAAPDFDADVLTARADLAAAERDLARVEGDPLALRLDLLQARQALEGARGSLEVATLAVEAEVAEAYFDALEADDALDIGRMQHSVATTTLEATQVRVEAGAATALDLERARNDLAAAKRDLADAEQARDLAYRNLGSLIGAKVAALGPMVASPLAENTLPDLAAVQDEAGRVNTLLKAAERNVELARARLEATDNAFSARADIEAAQDILANATTVLEDTRRSLDIAVQQGHNALQAAIGRFQSALASYQTSRDDLAAQRARLEAGSISPLAYQQAEIAHANTEAALNSALHAVTLARFALDQAVKGRSL